MGNSVPVRCPACRRDHAFVPSVFPCPCGAPLAPPLLRGAPPQPITHRTWTDSWVTVRCPSCGRQDQWPQPELGCGCGAVLRIPVRPVPTVPPAGDSARHPGTEPPEVPDTPQVRTGPPPGRTQEPRAEGTRPYGSPAGGLPPQGSAARGTRPQGPATSDARPAGAEAPGTQPQDADGPGTRPRGADGPGTRPQDADVPGTRSQGADGPGTRPEGPAAPSTPPHGPPQYPAGGPAPRPPFRPLTIRTARDAVTAAALYLKWLGFRGILQSPEHPASGIDLRAPGLVAQVDPGTSPSTLRDVECLWLHGLNASAVPVFFSLTGYEPAARARAEELGVPLFVLDLTGTPKPATRAADALLGSSTGTGG
ncbi:hypothetical protein [Streptomyces sp. NPDC058657]|uniref:hypothetical protein n=1 Tax=unclassified Streptomyces TaxID=2593676 RepID=UPI003663898F